MPMTKNKEVKYPAGAEQGRATGQPSRGSLGSIITFYHAGGLGQAHIVLRLFDLHNQACYRWVILMDATLHTA